jgi:CheY-like chemotaxis protein
MQVSGTKRVLIVGDEPEIAELIRRWGHVHLSVGDFQQAIGVAKTFAPHLALFALSLLPDGFKVKRLGVMPGLQAARLVALTDGVSRQPYEYGFREWLDKPIDAVQLLTAMKKCPSERPQ